MPLSELKIEVEKDKVQSPSPTYSPLIGAIVAIRSKIFLFVTEPDASILAKVFSLFMQFLIILSCIFMCAESTPDLRDYDYFWWISESTFVAFFSFEILLRVISHPAPWKLLVDFMFYIDCAAVIPYYVEQVAGSTEVDLRTLRALRLIRVIRVLKLPRYTTSFAFVTRATKQSVPAILLGLAFMAIALLIFSTLEYYAERGTFDEATELWVRCDMFGACGPSPFQSIPHTFWWCITTMTTVGYGDTVPVTPGGKTVGAFAMLAGILVIAFPTSILGSNLLEEFKLAREHKQRVKKSGMKKFIRVMNVSIPYSRSSSYIPPQSPSASQSESQLTSPSQPMDNGLLAPNGGPEKEPVFDSLDTPAHILEGGDIVRVRVHFQLAKSDQEYRKAVFLPKNATVGELLGKVRCVPGFEDVSMVLDSKGFECPLSARVTWFADKSEKIPEFHVSTGSSHSKATTFAPISIVEELGMWNDLHEATVATQ